MPTVRYFFWLDKDDRPLGLLRRLGVATDDSWNGTAWATSTLLGRSLANGDMNLDEVHVDTARAAFPAAFS